MCFFFSFFKRHVGSIIRRIEGVIFYLLQRSQELNRTREKSKEASRTMSTVKTKKTNSDVTAKILQSSPQNDKREKKKKTKKKKHLENAKKKVSAKALIKNNVVLPPKNSQQFSANWKTLQEALKLNSMAKSEEPKDKDATLGVSSNEAGAKKERGISQQGAAVRRAKRKAPVEENANGGTHEHNGSIPPHTSRSQHSKKKRPVGESDRKISEEDIWFDDVDPDDIEATLGPEAADIVRKRQGIKKMDAKSTDRLLVRNGAFDGLTKVVAMDCEMVGVGPDGEDSIVARASLVNQFGKCVYDKYVKPTERVTDYRTQVSGIRPKDIEDGENFLTVQKEVAEILNGRVLVGHAIHNDLKILFLDHPKKMIRDTQKYKPFKKIVKSGRPSLKLLCDKILNVKVQQGEHSSVQDAQATMRLYTLVKKEWERSVKAGHKNGYPEERERKTVVPKNKSNG
ncbi:hypothetical protein GN956_G21164 [Arapaima gigas]